MSCPYEVVVEPSEAELKSPVAMIVPPLAGAGEELGRLRLLRGREVLGLQMRVHEPERLVVRRASMLAQPRSNDSGPTGELSTCWAV